MILDKLTVFSIFIVIIKLVRNCLKRKKEEEAWAREEKKVKKKKEERRKWNVGGRRKAEWGSESGHCVHNDHYCVHSNLRKIGQRKCERLERSVLHSTTVGKKICERLESGCALYKLVQAVTKRKPWFDP